MELNFKETGWIDLLGTASSSQLREVVNYKLDGS